MIRKSHGVNLQISTPVLPHLTSASTALAGAVQRSGSPVDTPIDKWNKLRWLPPENQRAQSLLETHHLQGFELSCYLTVEASDLEAAAEDRNPMHNMHAVLDTSYP